MLALYSGDGTHFKYNKMSHKMTCNLDFLGWPLNAGKNNKERLTYM